MRCHLVWVSLHLELCSLRICIPPVFSPWVKFFLLNIHICVLFIIFIFFPILMKTRILKLRWPIASTTLDNMCLPSLCLNPLAGFEAWLFSSVLTSAVCRSDHPVDLSEIAQSIHAHVVWGKIISAPGIIKLVSSLGSLSRFKSWVMQISHVRTGETPINTKPFVSVSRNFSLRNQEACCMTGSQEFALCACVKISL